MSNELAYWLSMGLLAAGGVIVVYALLFDWCAQRMRCRRRRCPKCWYDLSHAPPPGLTCSECGYTAKRERKLFKARRHWRVAMLGVLLLIGSYAARVTPAIQDRGWPAAVPTTVILIVLPTLRPDMDQFDPYPDIPPSSPSWQDLIVRDLADERLDRIDLRGFNGWLLRAVCSLLSPSPVDQDLWPRDRDRLLGSIRWKFGRTVAWYEGLGVPEVQIETRPVWPRGEEVWLDVRTDLRRPESRLIATPLDDRYAQSWQETYGRGPHCLDGAPPFPWSDNLTSAGVCPHTNEGLSFNLEAQETLRSPLFIRRWSVDWNRTLEIKFEATESYESILEPNSSAALQAAIQTHLTPTLHRGRLFDVEGLSYSLTLFEETWDVPTLEVLSETTFAFHAEVRRGRKVVAECRAWFIAQKSEGWRDGDIWHLWPQADHIILHVFDEAAMIDENAVEPLTVRIKGCPRTAMRNFDVDRFWDGEIELPLLMELRDW